MSVRYFLAAAAIAALTVSFGFSVAPSNAASCSLAQQSGVTPNSGCQVGSTNNDSVAQVNADLMFTYSDWSFLEKQELKSGNWIEEPGSYDIGLTMTGDGQGGAWVVISNVWSIFDRIMLVLKSGGHDYIGYLLDGTSTSGNYLSVFVKNGSLQDISHISAYGHVGAVPLPAAVYLFGTALVGMGALGMKRRRARLSA